MDKLTYLAELAEGLARWVPERERQDILRYYAEYFEEAGAEREAEVVAELGDPWALSCRLAVEGGYVTQEKAEAWTPRQTRRKWPWVLTAACVVLVAVSVAWTASGVGRWLGGLVRFHSAETTVVEQGTAVADEARYGGGFWTVEDGWLEAFDEIDVDAGIANVTVTGGEDYTLSISSDTTLGGYSLKWEVKGGVLKIRDNDAPHVEINNWDDFKNIFGVNANAMDVIITVPEGTALHKLKAKTGLGDIFLSGLELEQKLEAETGLGGVECYEIRAHDDVTLESGMGDVTLGVSEPYSGVEFSLKSGMGTVEATVYCRETDWKYQAKTGMGTVTVNGDSRGSKAERKGDAPYELEAETGMGDVNLFFYDE